MVRDSIRVLVFYPVIIGLAVSAVRWLARDWSRSNWIGVAVMIGLLLFVWFPLSLVPYLKKRRIRPR